MALLNQVLVLAGAIEASFSACVELCDICKQHEAAFTVECGGTVVTELLHSAGVLADALLHNQTQVGLQRA